MSPPLLLLSLALLCHSLASASASPVDFCPALSACPQRSPTTGAHVSAAAHFDCIGRQLFTARREASAHQTAASSASASASASAAKVPRLTVDHDCGSLGWGNWISALPNSASLALTLGARLNVHHEGMARSFLPPFDDAIPPRALDNFRAPWFGYAEYGAAPKGFARFNDEVRAVSDFHRRARLCAALNSTARAVSVKCRSHRSSSKSPSSSSSSSSSSYSPPISAPTFPYQSELEAHGAIKGGSCSFDGVFLATGGCASRVLSDFEACAQKELPYSGHSIPFFHSLLARPSPTLQRILGVIRKRLNLPALAPGTEPAPGAHGLGTPGYYLIGLHFRAMPLGFEPYSIHGATAEATASRRQQIASFFEHSTSSIRRAGEIAKCRNQTLLIYFSTDDIANLRPMAVERWGALGRVVFGLRDSEVGHMAPSWEHHKANVAAIDESIARHLATSESAASSSSTVASASSSSASASANAKSSIIVEKPAIVSRSPHARQRHADWGIAEWWILAQCDWLVSSSSNFAITAAGAGLGPRGRMERFEHGSTHFRPQWERSDPNVPYCARVGAIDPAHAKSCPNSRQ